MLSRAQRGNRALLSVSYSQVQHSMPVPQLHEQGLHTLLLDSRGLVLQRGPHPQGPLLSGSLVFCIGWSVQISGWLQYRACSRLDVRRQARLDDAGLPAYAVQRLLADADPHLMMS